MVVNEITPNKPPPATSPAPTVGPVSQRYIEPTPYGQGGAKLSANTTWTLDESPYLITRLVQIQEGVTLTIEAGVNIKVEEGVDDAFLVHGTLIAEGTRDNPIIFDANGNNLFSGKYSLQAMSVKLNHTRLQNGRSVFLYGEGYFELANSIISNMTHVSGGRWTGIVISKNVFIDSAGIALAGVNGVFITNNKFISKSDWAHQHRDSWIQFSYFGVENTELGAIKHNSFLDNGIAVDAAVHKGEKDPVLANNYWGTVDPKEIADKFLDYNDDMSRYGTVIFEPFLTEPHPDTP